MYVCLSMLYVVSLVYMNSTLIFVDLKKCIILIAHTLKIFLLSFYLKRIDLILVFLANVIYQKEYLKKMKIQHRRLSTPLIMA